MIRRLLLAILLLAAIALAAGAAWAMLVDDGYVLIAWSHFRYQSTIWVFLLLCMLLWGLLYGLRRSLWLLLASTQLLNPWSSRNRMRRVEHATQRGFLELAAGHWEQALRLLGRAAALGEQPLMACLGAARAASELGELDRCEQLLAQALQREPKAGVAVALTRAQLQIDRGDDAAARATLQGIRDKRPRHAPTLRLLLALLRRQQDWAAIGELLPDLRRQKLLTAAEASALELQSHCARLRQAVQAEQPLAALQSAWASFGKSDRSKPELVACQAELLLQAGGVGQAEELLREALKRGYQEQLAALYVQTGSADPSRQLATAEAWLASQPDNAGLLLALGRLALRCQLWGKARDYLERSLKLERRAETCAELARLLASRFGETERSNQLFQEGLQLLGGPREQLPVPRKA